MHRKGRIHRKRCLSCTTSKKHPAFEKYVVFIDKNKGLYKIRAATPIKEINRYGTELQSLFQSIKDRIAKTYGEPQVIDTIDPESHLRDDNFWMHALNDGARKLLAFWGKSPLTDNLNAVALKCIASNPYRGYLMLEYEFKNYNTIEDDQDSVF